jgi:DEAD/DEAH box helicase domain-containing protein
VISTNALELGVDIGGLDAVLLNGYPGTVASTWQQAGRAGRSGGHSLAVLVAMEDPIDQFYMRHPEEFFGRSHEHARVNLENPYILADHLRCAAYEKPLSREDERYFGPELAPLVRDLAAEGLLVVRNARAYPPAASYPAEEVGIRSSSSQQFELVDSSREHRLIERVDAARALYELHPGAIYLHQGEEFLVTELDLAQHTAFARPASVSYYTQPRDVTDIQVIQAQRERPVGATVACFGTVDVTRTIVGYRRKAHYSEIMLGEHDLDLPSQSFETQAIWFTAPRAICQQVIAACGDLPGALHALEHTMIAMLPIFALCDRWDIGGVSTAFHPDTNEATIFIYDGVPGGVGIAELGFEQLEAWWRATLALLDECPCPSGCPSCVQSPKCGNGNQPLDKDGARALVECLLAAAQPSS